MVVGGGPGGTAAAIEAARHGRRVVLIDKASFPRDKCCGDGLTTGALRQLEALGLDPEAIPSWRAVTDVRVRTPSGRQALFPLPPSSPPGRGLFAAVARRAELDAALLSRAAEAGATVLEGHELVGLADTGGGVVATVEGHEGRIQLAGGHLIAADGMWSPTRKLLGLGEAGYRGDWHAFRQYFTGVTGRAATELLVWFEADLLPGYAWSFPIGDGGANVGFGILRRRGRSVQPMKQLWPRLLRRPHIAEALGDTAVPEAPHRAWPIPARLGGLPAASGRVLFVGDALAAADPMTGEGIGQALETGRAAVAAIVGAAGDGPDRVAASYRAVLQQGMERDHRLAGALSAILSRPAGANAAVAMVGATGWTRRQFARWLFEDYPRALLLTPGRWRRGVLGADGAFAGHESRPAQGRI